LNIDGLGARSIKRADGSTDPLDGELAAGRQVALTYDGAAFRLPPSTKVTDYLWFRTQTSNGTANVFAGNFACAATNGCGAGGPHGSGEPVRFWSASYPDGTSATAGILSTLLPGNWDGAAIAVKLHWLSDGSGAESVVWKLATACVAPGESLTSPAFNPAQSQTAAIGATAGALLQTTFSPVTVTGCAAGEEIHFQIARDPADPSDDYAGTAYLSAVQVIWTRNATMQ
jgi:hypothetical protein